MNFVTFIVRTDILTDYFLKRKEPVEMFRMKMLGGAALVMLGLHACAPTQPSKTNILNRPDNSSRQPVTPVQQNQTVFKNPEQIKTNNNPQPTAKPKFAIITPPVRTPDEMNTPGQEAKTPEYYRQRADYLQTFTKPLFNRISDSLIYMLSQTPATKRNPAVNATEWYATPNFNIRKPNYIILHHTAQNSVDQTLYTFSIQRTEASAHYVVGRDGIIYQLLNDYMRAWHAGSGKWGSVTDMNSCSIGIEIDNNGKEPFSDVQINALIKLLDYLKEQYDIPQANFIGHLDIAPRRKEDPSSLFPWKKLADAGFGYWYNINNLKDPPADFNALLAMRVIGYDIKDQAKAIEKFKIHFVQTDVSPTLTDWDKKILYNVYLNY